MRVVLAGSIPWFGLPLGAREAGFLATGGSLLQASYLGGSLNDYAFAVAIHPRTGEVFVAGMTESLNFPAVAGSAQPSYGSGIDKAFVARLNPTLTVLERATYFGGSRMDIPYAIAIHPNTDEVFVAGLTASADLPGTAGGAQPRHGGGYDAFVARFDPTLTQLRQATYLGGTGGEGVSALAIDPASGDVFVAGETTSPDFPGTARGAQAAKNGAPGYDAFIARLNSTLTVLKQATYLGGDGGLDVAMGLALHPVSGDVVVVGETDSTDFPGTAGGAQATCGRCGSGVTGAFVARLDPTLTALKQSTYLGADGSTLAVSVAIDPVAGDVLIAGDTSSMDFPGALGGAQDANSGASWDGFVARLSSSLTVLTQASYLGGAGVDFITTLAIHPMTGEVFVAGDTTSTNLPGTAGAAQKSSGGGLDAFISRFDSTLTLLNRTTYLGGSERETAWALAVDPTGDIVVAGDTRSRDFPAMAGGAQPSYGGGDLYGGDAFIARFTRDLAATPVKNPPRSTTSLPRSDRSPEPRLVAPR